MTSSNSNVLVLEYPDGSETKDSIPSNHPKSSVIPCGYLELSSIPRWSVVIPMQCLRLDQMEQTSRISLLHHLLHPLFLT